MKNLPEILKKEKYKKVKFKITKTQHLLIKAKINGVPGNFNTDQGSQYTSEVHTNVLLNNEIKISMDGKGRAIDNIFIERLWRIVNTRKYIYKHILMESAFIEDSKIIFNFIINGEFISH